MKRNLQIGIILISAVALSSCSYINQLPKTAYTGDDVYHTKAQAGDQFEYIAQYTPPQENFVPNDDYYYYGDYESRINRFSYYTPFDYDDDFYYNYTPYGSPDNNYSQADSIADVPYEYSDDTAYDFGNYSAYDFGYGDYGGYDNFGYGIAYSTYLYGGGGRINHKKSYSYSNNNTGNGGLAFTRANGGSNRIGKSRGLNFAQGNGGTNNTNAGTGLSFTRGNNGGSNAVYPGRPGTTSVTQTNNATNNTRVRPVSENPRPVIEQPTVERAAPPSQSSRSSNSSSGSGGSGGGNSGGGGRPVRP